MLAAKLARRQARITQAALKAGRNPAEVTLVGVSKTVGREVVEEAFQAGLRDFGENRVGDMEEKFSIPPYPAGMARLHLIGHFHSLTRPNGP